jgi:sugar lactone lactonase YvrE
VIAITRRGALGTINRFFVLFALFSALVWSSFSGTAAQAVVNPSDTPSPVTSYGSYGSSRIEDANSIAVDGQGNRYVMTDYKGIVKVDVNNRIIDSIGYYGCGPSVPAEQFCPLRGLTVSGSGEIYVADSYNGRVLKFNSDGTAAPASMINISGSMPAGVVVDSQDNIYIIDQNQSQVWKYNDQGGYITSWGGYGAGDDKFYAVHAIAIDAADNIYVADTYTGEIKKFSSGGVFQLKMGSTGFGDGQFNNLSSIAVDQSGVLYAADNSGRIQRFDTSNGNYLGKWSEPTMSNILSVSLDGSGNLLAMSSQGLDTKIYKFNTSNGSVDIIDRYLISDSQFDEVTSSTHDPQGNLYAVDTGANRIVKFDPSGNPLKVWGSYGSDDGEMITPYYIKYNPHTGNLMVADSGNNRIQVFDKQGNFLSKIGTTGGGDGQLYKPTSLAIDGSGNFYVTDMANYRIQKFDANGNFITKWGSQGSGDGQFRSVFGIDVDRDGFVYVVDAQNNNVQKFDANGNFITKWGSQGSGDGQLNFPVRIAVDVLNNVYVSEFNNSRIQKFDSNGGYLSKWGSSGNDLGEFAGPGGVEVDTEGNVYVTELAGGRVQKFSYPPEISRVDDTVLSTNPFTKVSCHSVNQEYSLEAGDDSYSYPAGFVDFCLDTPSGLSQTIDLRFKTDLDIDKVVVRKYNSVTKQYSDVSNTTVSEFMESGQRYIRVVYTATDGGANDEDGAVNGKIIDPIGLGVTTSSGSNNTSGGSSQAQGQGGGVNKSNTNKDNPSVIPGVPNTGFWLDSQPVKYLAVALGIMAIVAVAILWRKIAGVVKTQNK